jgi:hypothetical protein
MVKLSLPVVSYSVEGPATSEEGASVVLALLGVGPVAGVYPDFRKGKATSEALGLASWAIAADAGMFSGMKNLQKILCKSLKALSGLEDRAEDASSMLLANSTGTGPATSSPLKREALMGHSRSCTVIAVSLDRYGIGLCIGVRVLPWAIVGMCPHTLVKAPSSVYPRLCRHRPLHCGNV